MSDTLSNQKIFGYSLSYAMSHFDKFKELSPQDQTALLLSAQKFEEYHGSHFLSPDELSEQLGGQPSTWRRFLTLKPVRDYITRRVQEDTEIMNRQALYKQAQKAALSGDTQAAKYITALAEANTSQTNQQTIILHYIPRPKADAPSVPKAD